MSENTRHEINMFPSYIFLLQNQLHKKEVYALHVIRDVASSAEVQTNYLLCPSFDGKNFQIVNLMNFSMHLFDYSLYATGIAAYLYIATLSSAALNYNEIHFVQNRLFENTF